MIWAPKYWQDFYHLVRSHSKFKGPRRPVVKLEHKLLLYEKKQALLQKHHLTSKKSFRKLIYKTAKLRASQQEKVILFKIKSGAFVQKAQATFIANEKKRRKRLALHYLSKAMLYLVLVLYLFITLYPFVWSIFSSFKDDLEIANGSFNPFPQEWTTKNYQDIFGMGDGLLQSWILNSFIVAFCGTLGNLFLNTFCGYALARIKLPGKNKILWSMITLMMVPGQVGIIPNYILLKYFGMTNTLYSLFVPAFINISFIFMSRQFFINFPKDVEEAAKIDGQNRVSFVLKQVMPLMKPMLMTQAVFSFMGFWNNFIMAKMYIDTPANYTLTVGIQSILERDANQVSYGQILAGASISIFPILILYIVLNSAFMTSNRTGGSK